MGDFTLAFQNINELTTKQLETVIRSTVFSFSEDIIVRSPADTGRFKGNWIMSLDKPIDSELDTLDKSGNATVSKVKSTIYNNRVPFAYYFQNNLKYANKIEYGLFTEKPETLKTIGGYSKQAPRGLVRVAMLNFGKYLKGNIK